LTRQKLWGWFVFWSILVLWNCFLVWPLDKAVFDVRFAATYLLATLTLSFLFQLFWQARQYFKVVVYVLLYLLWNYTESTYGVFAAFHRYPPHAFSALTYSANIVVLAVSCDLLMQLATVRLSGKLRAMLAGCLQAAALAVPLIYVVYTKSTGVALTVDSFVAIFVNHVQDATAYITTYIRPYYLAAGLGLLAVVWAANLAEGRRENALTGRVGGWMLVGLVAVSAGYCLFNPTHSGLVNVVKQGTVYLGSLEQNPHSSAVKASGGAKGLYVVVIGESQVRDHMGALRLSPSHDALACGDEKRPATSHDAERLFLPYYDCSSADAGPDRHQSV
jgi:hypothetical protein